MTRDEAVAFIQLQLGQRGDLASNIQTMLQYAQIELEREAELPWFLKTEVATAATVSGEARVPLPSDFLREIDDDDEAGLWYYNADADEDERWTELEKIDMRTLRAAYQDSVGPPEAYALDDEYFRLGPTPDGAYQLKMIYYHKDVTLTTNVENKWLKYAHELMIGKAGRKISGGPLRDAEAFSVFQAMEAAGKSRIMVETVARREANRTRVRGGED